MIAILKRIKLKKTQINYLMKKEEEKAKKIQNEKEKENANKEDL